MNKLLTLGILFACFMLLSCGESASNKDTNEEDSQNQEDSSQTEEKMESIYQYDKMGEIDPAKIKTVKGTVQSAGETGRGPEIQVTLKTEDGEDFDFYLLEMGENQFPVGSKYVVRYKIDSDSLIVGIGLANENIEKATAHLETEYDSQKIARKEMKAAAFKLKGTYLTGEHGDMGKYVSIKQDDQELHYDATFVADVDNVERYLNKEVVLYGKMEENVDVLELLKVE